MEINLLVWDSMVLQHVLMVIVPIINEWDDNQVQSTLSSGLHFYYDEILNINKLEQRLDLFTFVVLAA